MSDFTVQLPSNLPISMKFSAAIPGIVYALLGTSRQLNVAPEAALSLLLGQAISEFHLDHPDPHSGESDAHALAIASVITLQVKTSSFQVFPPTFLTFFALGGVDLVLAWVFPPRFPRRGP